MTKPFRYTLFAMLYFVQGAVMAYFTALNALYLKSFDLDLGRIGIIGAIGLIPFVLKIFLGMLSDRVNLLGLGHRRPYILIGLVVQAACLAAAPLINPGQNFGGFALLAFLMMTGMALYDTCADGLALDTTPVSERGTVQGLMVGGRAAGVVVIAGLIGLLVERTSWPVAFYTLAGFSLLPIPLALSFREPARAAAGSFQWSAFAALTGRRVLALAALGALYSLVIYGANQLVNPFLQDTYTITIGMAGLYTTVWGMGVVVGGLTGGRLIDRVGHRRAALWAMLASLAAVLLLSAIASPGAAWPLVAVFGLAFGYYETVYFAMAMDLTDPRVAASMFAILMAVANIGTGIGLAASGVLAGSLGYRATFALFAGLNLLALPLLGAIFRPVARTSAPAAARDEIGR